MSDREREDIRLATIYKFRLMLTNGEKERYSVDEIAELLDKIATE